MSDCENVDCFKTASDLRRFINLYTNEVEKREKLELEIKELKEGNNPPVPYNTDCQQVACENVNCHINAANVRYWKDAYLNKSNEYGTEYQNNCMKSSTIWNLNREVEKLHKDLKSVREVFSEFYEPRLQALQKVKYTLDKYDANSEDKI
jgi:hypothetical protein